MRRIPVPHRREYISGWDQDADHLQPWVQTGGTFTKAYPAVIQFAALRGTLLATGLADAISGNVTAWEVALKTGANPDDYKLSYYERDSSDSAIDGLLNDNSDVLPFRKFSL